jgi:hypothetical protein
MVVGTPTSRGWRLVRAGVFAVVATQLAALGHLLAGGALPDPAVLLTVTVFLGGSLSGFTGGRRTGPQIVAALLASQLAFHLTFSLTAHPMAGESGGLVEPAGMVAFHLLAAVAAGWLMTAGESTLFRLFAALHRALLTAVRVPPVGLAPHWTARVPAGVAGLQASFTELSAGSRRGPPRSVLRHG